MAENDWDDSAVDLHYLFSAPINAVIEADYRAARQFVEYIEQYGFTHEPKAPGSDDREIGDLKMVSFRFEQMGPDNKPQTRYMRMPMLSMIPLPLLQVSKADFSFGVRILDNVKEPKPKNLNLLGRGPDDDAAKGYKWRAVLAADRGGGAGGAGKGRDISPHMDANINVKLEVRQSGIPAGINNMLALMGESAQVCHGTIRPQAARLVLAPPPKGQQEGTAVDSGLVTHSYTGAPIGGQAVVIAYPADAMVVKVGGAAWATGTSMPTDDKGNMAFSVALLAGSPYGPGQNTPGIRFTSTIEGCDVAAFVRVDVAE